MADRSIDDEMSDALHAARAAGRSPTHWRLTAAALAAFRDSFAVRFLANLNRAAVPPDQRGDAPPAEHMGLPIVGVAEAGPEGWELCDGPAPT